MSGLQPARVTVARDGFINVEFWLKVPRPCESPAWRRDVARASAAVLCALGVVESDECWMVRERCRFTVVSRGVTYAWGVEQ